MSNCNCPRCQQARLARLGPDDEEQERFGEDVGNHVRKGTGITKQYLMTHPELVVWIAHAIRICYTAGMTAEECGDFLVLSVQTFGTDQTATKH